MIAISALVLIGVAAGVGLLLRHNAPANATPADNSSTATAAYPLHAHLEQWGSQNVTTCDSGEASAKRGSVTSIDTGPLDDVVVRVNFHGPGVINVDVQDGNGHRYHFVQQVTKKDTGAQFAAIAPAPYKVAASARMNSSAKPGATCTIPVN
jgi:hypothetical protein